MPELAEITTPKTAGFVERGSNYSKRKQQMETEEKEIAELEAQQRGEPEEEVTEEKEADTEAKEETLSAEEKSFKKRYGDLRRHMGEKEKEWKERLEALENRLENTSVIPPKSDEDIAEWSKKYPDVSGIVETIAAKKAQEMFSKAEKRLEQIDEVQNEAKRVELEAEIREEHSDFDELKSADKFHNWAEKQPKIDHKITKDDKKANKKAAASVVTKRTKTSVDADEAGSYIKESDVAKMSSKDFEKNQDKINDALRANKFIYDISGTAR